MVESVEQIQKVIRFANRNDIRLTIKNTGHSFSGQSTAPNSLQLFTYNMKNISFTDNFIPEGGDRTHGKGYGPAVTYGAGVQLRQLYDALASKGLMAVGGYSATVGAAGGFIQGGGHGALSSWKGLAADNAFEFKLVNAKVSTSKFLDALKLMLTVSQGEYITANEHVNSDTFWALRGGGGGTFGAVVSVTIRTFKDVPVTVAFMQILKPSPDKSYWESVQELLQSMPGLIQHGRSAYISLIPSRPISNFTTDSFLSLQLQFINNTDSAIARDALSPLITALNSIEGGDAMVNITQYSAVNEFYTSFPSDASGANVYFGSRLISREFFESDDGPAKLADVLRGLEYNVNEAITGAFVSPEQVGLDGDITPGAVNPAWRKTLCHLYILRGWYGWQGLEMQKQVQDDLTHRQMPLLDELEHGKMGAYLNEADPNEPNFQQQFWGENYDRLLSIKQKVDPTSLFLVRKGVGSEYWDGDGFCQISR